MEKPRIEKFGECTKGLIVSKLMEEKKEEEETIRSTGLDAYICTLHK